MKKQFLLKTHSWAHPFLQRRSLLCLIVSVLLVLPLRGELIGYEPFTYGEGSIGGATGGAYWDYKNTTTTGHTGTPSNWDVLAGAPSVVGRKLVTTGTDSAKREYDGAVEADGAVNGANVAKKVYYKVTFTYNSNVSFAGMSSFDFTTERVFFGIPFGQSNFGVQIAGVNPVLSNTMAVPGQTYTLVAKLDFVGQAISLFVNPNLSQAEPGTPTATTAYTATNWSTAVRLASGGNGSVTWDDLTVATTWENLGHIVTTTADAGAGSLRQVLADASAATGADVVTFAPALSGQTITLTSEIVINDSGGITVDASALPGGVTIANGPGNSRIFTVNSNTNASFTGLALTGGNSGGNFGGAVSNAGTLTLTQCTLAGNSGDIGGAIWNTGRMHLFRSTLSGNNASNSGGAIQNDGSMADLTYCTLTGNSSFNDGGAIDNTAPLSLTNCTVSGNTVSSASANGGGVKSTGASNTYTNCIVAGNISGNGGHDIDNNNAALTMHGQNIVQSLSTASGSQSFDALPINANPLLAPLDNYGGNTKTMALLPGSPARNAGSTGATSDQRGFPIIGLPDIGAYEAGTLNLNFNAYIWESLPVGATVAQHDGSFDFDGDGMSNLDEFLTQTDAADATSFLHITQLTLSGRNLTITFPSVAGRHYSVEASTDLHMWTLIDGPFVGPGGPIILGFQLANNPPSKLFFHVLGGP